MLSNAAREILGIKISVSKATLALTQLNQPVSVDSNITSTSVLVYYKIHSEQKITIFRNGIETIKRFDVFTRNYSFSAVDQIKNSAKRF